MSVESYEGKTLVVLWAPGGQNRPYKAPKEVTARQKDYRYFIRRYANTVVPKEHDLPELMSLTATVPFDDRLCHQADLEDLRLSLIRSFLKEVKSGLYRPSAKTSIADLGRQMSIVDGGDEYLKPRNVGMMFFNDTPERFFPGTQIDVVQFPQGVAGDRLVEKVFKGPIHQQLRDALRHVQNSVLTEQVTKDADRAEARRVFNYPYAAVEEALVNAVYHRSYEQREPIEIRVNPDCIEIISYPGPDPSIKLSALNSRQIIARRYRNRRIGEFLKELRLTEGRSTGIPKMREAMRANGSPPPKFVTDRSRTYFLVILPIQPEMLKAQAMDHEGGHDGDHDQGDLSATERRILVFCSKTPASSDAIHQHLGYKSRARNVREALARLMSLSLLEYTLPAKPKSKKQKYRLTSSGRRLLSR